MQNNRKPTYRAAQIFEVNSESLKGKTSKIPELVASAVANHRAIRSIGESMEVPITKEAK